MRDPAKQLLSDPDLWGMLISGGEAAFQELYKRHYTVLLRYGTKIHPDKALVQDCLQEVFYQLWMRRTNLASVTSVRFYLMKWMRRELIRVAKKSAQEQVLDDEVMAHLTLDVDDFFVKEQEDEVRTALIRKALDELSPRERQVVYMRFFLEMPYEEICEALGLGYQVVMNYLSRALKVLKANPYLSRITLALALVQNIWTAIG